MLGYFSQLVGLASNTTSSISLELISFFSCSFAEEEMERDEAEREGMMR
jgi:hypothetical protein